MKHNKKLIVSSLTAALALFLMITAGLFSIGLYAVPALAGILYIILARELGCRWALMSYAVTAIMSLILCADKEAALNFILFFGYYPILKTLIEKLKLFPLKIIIKLAVFNAAMISIFYIAKFLLMIPDSSYVIFGVYIPWLLLIAGNFVFLLYDFALTGLILKYDKYWSGIIGKIIR